MDSRQKAALTGACVGGSIGVIISISAMPPVYAIFGFAFGAALGITFGVMIHNWGEESGELKQKIREAEEQTPIDPEEPEEQN